MKSELYQGSIVVKKSPVQGYGVFAKQHFKPGELIEECRVILGKHENSYKNYVFATDDERVAMPLGFGAIYNHAPKPNARYRYRPEWELLEFTALSHITKGEEILVSYGEKWFSDRFIEVKYPFRYRVRRFFTRTRWRVLLVIGFILCLTAFLKSQI